ncbi:SDR family NAD(P)-dependent oxidoreductase [Nocardia speluncae]|uniref:SDR family NAD(P)-dependent oxidoreductase n=1 Tax=Nocardia speluncae TaxID=419477 RepID=A0A846XCR5_9NOCA|nr:SDR family NAD(P)-dependent oxidoreductase [Nocardia speluncae]NKY32466.1 SDR family NAD(P)-dependent oxidoreductase [Nocardia speluncae]
MRTIVITGGTDGMGRALARHYLAAGDRVVVIGRDQAKFEALRDAVGSRADLGSAAVHAPFIAADLSSIADTRRVVEQVRREHERIDALVLAASFIRQRRQLTNEGYEGSWVLFFVSKYLFVTGLADRLRSAARPIVVNTAVPGARADAIDFDDPGMSRGFTFTRSNAQQRRANELLGLLATADDPRLAYVTWGPSGLVRTSFAGEVGPGMKITAAILGTLVGKRPDIAVRPIIDLIDAPAPGRAAYRGTKPAPLVTTEHDRADSARLTALIERDFQ